MRNLYIVVTLLFLTVPAVAAGGGPALAAVEPAMAAFNAGDFAAAVAQLDRLTRQHPGDVALRLNAAIAKLQVNDVAGALGDLRTASTLAPQALLIQKLLQNTQQQVAKMKAPPMTRAGGTALPMKSVFTTTRADFSIDVLTDAVQRYPESSPLANLLGDAYHLTGNMAEAEKWYSKASALAPGWYKPKLGVAIVVINVDPSKAATLLEGLVSNGPSVPQAQLWLGDAYRRSGREEQALRAYRTAERFSETAADARLRLGTMMLARNQVADAELNFQRAQELRPEDPAAHLGRAQAAPPGTNTFGLHQSTDAVARAKSPETKAALYTNMALMSSNGGNVPEANTYWFKAIENSPESVSLYAAMARDFKKNKILDQQLVEAEGRRLSSPTDIPTLLFLAEGYKQAGRPDQELQVLELLAHSDKRAPWMWQYRKAERLWETNRRDLAVASLLEAVDLAYPLRTVLIASSIAKLPDAVPVAIQALKDQRNNKSATHLLYEIYRQQGQFSEALESLERTISLDRNNAHLHDQKAVLLVQMGRQQEAASARERQRALILDELRRTPK